MSDITLLLLAVPLYVIWRHYSAYKAKLALAEELDSYLGDSKQPELLKKIVFSMYQDSMDPLLPLKMQLSRRGRKLRNSETEQKLVKSVWKREIDELPKDEVDKFYILVAKAVLVNIKVAPMSHVLMIVISAIRALSEQDPNNFRDIPTAEKEFAGDYLNRFSI